VGRLELVARRSFVLRSAIGSAILGVLIVIALANFAPDASPYSPNNYGWNGVRDLASHYPVQFVNSLVGLKNQRAVLLIMQPANSFSPSQAQEVYLFAFDGGRVVLAGDSPALNSLLQAMGTAVTIQGQYSIRDATYNWKGQTLPVALVNQSLVNAFGFLAGLNGVAMDQPSPLVIAANSSAQPAALTSSLSFETVRSSSLADIPLIGSSSGVIAKGPFVVAAAESLGAGTVVVLGDSQFFTNSLWNTADNDALMANLFSNATVYVDASHWQGNTGASLRGDFAAFYSQASGSPLRYLLTLAFVGVAVGTLPVFTSQGISAQDGGGRRKRSGTAYNMAILERVRNDRRKYGVQAG
jgi:hypothetical protein